MKHWPWKFISLWVAIAILLIITIGAKSNQNLSNYPRVCNQSGVYNNDTGFDQTVYYPCSYDIP